MDEIDFLKVVDKPAGILTPDQLARLLRVAGADMILFVAIGAFTGMRASEIRRLDWRQVNLAEGYIEVFARISKTATRRSVKIQPALRAWLEAQE